MFAPYCVDLSAIPKDVQYCHDSRMIIIKDRFPKAIFVTEEVKEPELSLLTHSLGEKHPALDFKMGFCIIPAML